MLEKVELRRSRRPVSSRLQSGAPSPDEGLHHCSSGSSAAQPETSALNVLLTGTAVVNI